MKKIAIITARGGSKRIPHKNMLPFLGKPIIAYSIEAALSSGEFDEVMVSTDDENIAKIAKEYGASVPFMRSERTANDFASTADVLFEVLDEYEKRGEYFDVLCCIYPTAVFITDKKIKEAMGKLVNSDFDTLLPVVKFSYPVQRSLVKNGEGLEFKYPEYIDARSQDLEPHFHDAGQFYIMKTEDFKRNREIMKGKIMPYELPEMEVQDIDTMSDWHIAEIKFQAMKGEN